MNGFSASIIWANSSDVYTRISIARRYASKTPLKLLNRYGNGKLVSAMITRSRSLKASASPRA